MIDIKNKVKLLIEWLAEKKAEHIDTYDLTGINSFTDYIIICEGQADLHVRAIGDYLLDRAKENHFSLLSKEGIEYSHWILIDLGDVIIHVFMPETRHFYKIDEFIKNYITKAELAEK